MSRADRIAALALSIPVYVWHTMCDATLACRDPERWREHGAARYMASVDGRLAELVGELTEQLALLALEA